MKKSNLQTLSSIALFLSIVFIGAVMPATAAGDVTRDLPDAVSSEGDVYVTLNQSGFSLIEVVVVTEILPEGFEYVVGTAKDSEGEQVFPKYNETTKGLEITFLNRTSITYIVEAGTKGQIETAVFSGTWIALLSDDSGYVKGDENITFAEEPTPTPTATAAPGGGNGGGGNGGGGGGGIPPAPPAETPAYIHLNATPADVPADGTSTSTITASVWDGDEWVMENRTVNFSADSGDIPASAAIVNGTATGVLTAGTEEGIANVRAETNLSGDIGVLNATITVNFTTPGVTPTPTATPTAEVTPEVTATATPAGRWGIPGFEVIFAIAGLLAVAYLVKRRRRG